MANFCNFEIRVKGTRGNAMLVYASMPAVDDCPITYSRGTDSQYEIHFRGCTKWSVNYDVTDDWDGSDLSVDLNTLSNDDIYSLGDSYLDYSLKAKSRVLQCEILVLYWSDESNFNQFDHYINGVCIKQRKISYFPDKASFNWDVLEFEGHEGEYDNTIEGDALGDRVMGNIMADFQRLLNPLGLIDDTEDSTPSWADNFTCEELFDWKFTQGNRYEGDGWSVAIPDGFCVWEGPDANEYDTIIFVPKLYRFYNHPEESTFTVTISINPQYSTTQLFADHQRVTHSLARLGYAESFARIRATLQVQMSAALANDDSCVDIQGFVSAHFSTAMLVTPYEDGSYLFEGNIMSNALIHPLGVFAEQVPDESKQMLIASIDNWLRTYQNPGHEYVPTPILQDEKLCIKQLLADDTTELDKAIEQIKTEISIAGVSRIECLKYRLENRMILPREAKELNQTILDGRNQVRMHYVQRLDALLDQLKAEDLSQDTMAAVYAKLLELLDANEQQELSEDGIIAEANTSHSNADHAADPSKLVLNRILKKWREESAALEAQGMRRQNGTNPDDIITNTATTTPLNDAQVSHPVPTPPTESTNRFAPIRRGEAASVSISEVLHMTSLEVMMLLDNYFTKQPNIIFDGKKFLFTGDDICTDDHPIVQQVTALGGTVEFNPHTSDPMDYLIVGNNHPLRTLIAGFARKIDNGNPIQLIYLEDLEASLGISKRAPIQRGEARSVPLSEWVHMTSREVVALLEHYFTKQPNIIFDGKNFLFTGCDICTDDHPVVQRIKTLGGTVELKYNPDTGDSMDYLIVGNNHPLRTLIAGFARKIDNGNPIQLIHLKDLETALESSNAPFAEEPSQALMDEIATPTLAKRAPLQRGEEASVSIDELTEMTNDEVIALFENYFTKDPQITFQGKIFQIVSSGISEDHPIVRRIQALGGQVVCTILSLLKHDYVVVGGSTSRALIQATAKRIDLGYSVQLIYLEDLVATLNSNHETMKEQSFTDSDLPLSTNENGVLNHTDIPEDVVELDSNCTSPATPSLGTLEDLKQEQERAAAEQRKQSKRDQLAAERDALQQELNALKGLFAAFKRKKLQERIAELDQQLRHL